MTQQAFSSAEDEVIKKFYPTAPWPVLFEELKKIDPAGKLRWSRRKQISDRAHRLGVKRDRAAVLVSQDLHEELTDPARAEQAKLEVVLKENRQLKKQLRRRKAEQDLVADLITANLTKIQPRKITPLRPPPKKTRWRSQIMSLGLSDVHAGQVVKSTDVAGLSEYSWSAVEERMDVLRDAILEIAESMPEIPFAEFWINALGDLVTGEDIYMGQGRRIDKDLVEQLFELAELISTGLIEPLCQYFPKVRMNCVWGNHGRTGRKGTHSARTNFDYILYRHLKARLSRIKNFSCFISDSAFMAFDCMGSIHCLMHGDSINRYMQVPFYGIQRAHAQLIQLTGLFIDYLWIGHHHQAATIDASVGKKILNGSWTGADELSVTKMHAGNQPKQVLCGFNETRGMTWQFDIQLAPRRHLVADEAGIYTPIYKGQGG